MTVRIAITPGEPAGVGPDIIVSLAQKSWPAELVVCADASLIAERAEKLNIPLTLRPYNKDVPPQPQEAGTLTIADIKLSEPVIPGTLDERNAGYVVETLTFASERNMEGEFSAIVTGPVNKEIINRGGISFSGHTEFFAQHANSPDVVMMLASEQMRVALVTTHLPLAYVAKAITPERLKKVIQIIRSEMRLKFGMTNPRILVCGLNPHAGEGGHLGREEIDVIIPVLDELRELGYDLQGPLPADTLFQEKYLADADVVLSMFHDQGLPVLKYQGFGRSLNITLGLPYIRTSVDHGTALELAGTDKVDSGSFEVAINQALELVSNSISEE